MTTVLPASGRRLYNKWVANPVLEDYALRFTPASARRWSTARIANTAFGAASFLACEAIGATITLAYGFSNAVAAIVAAMVLLFAVGLPIAYHAARAGLDVDLLTRGAGFGYIGSTITSLIYASFTFLLFAIEASILSMALQLLLGIPLPVAHIISSLIVIPIALYGMRAITRLQAWTQPVWLVLQLAPIAWIVATGGPTVAHWLAWPGRLGASDGSVDLLLFGLALSTLLSLLPQIGEQADYLRFLPKKTGPRWWAAVIAGGPGWVVIGGLKLLLGSYLARLALDHRLDAVRASAPPDMFLVIFTDMVRSPMLAMALTMVLVVTAQMKINVTNAYAGSIAWSNFFSRLSHAHPGRVVWLVFNVLLALLLMEIGIFAIIENILTLYANLAAGWIGALVADLVISKPLGLSPPFIEFKRARLYDINPVGVGAMLLSIIVSTGALVGILGPLAQAFAPLLGLAVAFVAAPAIALLTRGHFYIAREADLPPGQGDLECVLCGNAFERPDMAFCPIHAGSICSLCCTLEARCHDICKDRSSFGEQAMDLLQHLLPAPLARQADTLTGHFLGVLALFTAISAGVLYFIDIQYATYPPAIRATVATTLWVVFFALSILSGIAAWLLVLAHDSRRAAERETTRNTAMLMDEIAAHSRTDAALKRARDAAEAANLAKSRYLVGVSHEIRSPLNAIYGYAQLLEREGVIDPEEAGRVIRRSSEHLTNIVDGLLDISRIESGVLKLSRDTVPLPAFLAQIADMFRMQAQEKGIAFHYDPPANLPAFVRTDEKRLRQILINLLSNAIKYTAEGEAALAVRYRGLVAEFEVSDTGVGIAPADLERIFEPFERGGADATNGQPGTGLGLAITRVLAQVMGGDVSVRSKPGEGSRFTLRLMLAEPGEAPPATARLRPVSGYAGNRRTILVIDDDPAQLAVLQGLLRPLGFTVYAASNGAVGLDLADRCDPDLVLLDIQMPGLSGWTVAARLRAAHGDRLKIVMVSANAHEFAAGDDGNAAHDGFVLKPVELETLLDVVATRLGLAWDSAAPGAPPAAAPAIDLEGAGSHIAELRRLGQLGHVRGIEAGLADLERDFPESQALVAQLRDKVRAFDLKAYLKLLDPMATNSVTILVVDDTPESLRFVTATLEKAGMTVLIAGDGAAALQSLELAQDRAQGGTLPDLIIMDAVMPVLDGFETTKRIKADPRFARLPVIFMTGLTETEHVVRGLEAGGVDYVHKPIVVEELLARIRVHLGNARVSSGSQAALDESGRPLLAIDSAGRILWTTPRSAEMLGRLFGGDGVPPSLPAPLAASLARLAANETQGLVRHEIDGGRLELTLLTRSGSEEWLFRLTEIREGAEERLLATRHGLTEREAEVLLWISRGKANREISEILGISPRTVNKHLEQVFEKMGIENRASAAAAAVKTLAG